MTGLVHSWLHGQCFGCCCWGICCSLSTIREQKIASQFQTGQDHPATTCITEKSREASLAIDWLFVVWRPDQTMAPLILHNVPDDELYVGDDGIQRPYAMVFPQYAP